MNDTSDFFRVTEDEFRRPLPPTGTHPERTRAHDGRTIPPYFAAWQCSGGVAVMLCEGNGWRATADGQGVREGETPWLYADSDDVPAEWKEPVARMLAEVNAKWPGLPVEYRDRE